MNGTAWIVLWTLILTTSACGGRRGGGGDDDDDLGDGDADTDTDADADGDGDGDADGCIDDDLDGICWQDDCDDLDATIGPCSACPDDGDCDGTPDAIDCYDDFEHEYTCVDTTCTAADNYCPDPWYLVYCVEGTAYGADCDLSCRTDEATWSQACSAPAFAGQCGDAEGACLCWCEDSFDSCVDEFTIRYIREGATYEADCKDYCGGTCDADLGACVCP